MLNFKSPGASNNQNFPPNCTLSFRIPSLSAGANSVGNANFTENVIVLSCYLKLDPKFYKKEDLLNQPGSDKIAIELAGFLEKPRSLPKEIRPGAEGDCIINLGNSCLTGKFELKPTIQNPIVQAMRIKDLNRIRGTLRVGRRIS